MRVNSSKQCCPSLCINIYQFIALIILVYYLKEEHFNKAYINRAKHLRLKMINFQRVDESCD